MTDLLAPSPARFPAVSAALLTEQPSCDLVDGFIDEIEAWRQQALHSLANVTSTRRVSSGLSNTVAWLLGDRAEGGERTAPYLLTAYTAPPPRTTQGCDERRRWMTEVLIWRWRVFDYLSDVWDTLDDPGGFEPAECGIASEWFLPESEALCPGCLQPIAVDAVGYEQHRPACTILRLTAAVDAAAGAPWTKGSLR
jgi:hypothetical protein